MEGPFMSRSRVGAKAKPQPQPSAEVPYSRSAAAAAHKSQPLQPLLRSSLPRTAAEAMVSVPPPVMGRGSRTCRRSREVRVRRGAVAAATPSVLKVARAAFRRHPLVFNCFSLGALYTAAEISQQTINRAVMARSTAKEKVKATGSVVQAEAAVAAAVAAIRGPEQRLSDQTSTLVAPPKLRPPSILRNYDLDSVKRYAVLGTCAYGPMFHAWYKWLDSKLVGTGARVVAKKIFLDQFVLGPPSLAFFFLAMSYLEGKEDVTKECRKKFLPTYALDCLYWIPIQVCNFVFISPTYRVLYLGCTAFVWAHILCIAKNFENYYTPEQKGQQEQC